MQRDAALSCFHHCIRRWQKRARRNCFVQWQRRTSFLAHMERRIGQRTWRCAWRAAAAHSAATAGLHMVFRQACHAFCNLPTHPPPFPRPYVAPGSQRHPSPGVGAVGASVGGVGDGGPATRQRALQSCVADGACDPRANRAGAPPVEPIPPRFHAERHAHGPVPPARPPTAPAHTSAVWASRPRTPACMSACPRVFGVVPCTPLGHAVRAMERQAKSLCVARLMHAWQVLSAHSREHNRRMARGGVARTIVNRLCKRRYQLAWSRWLRVGHVLDREDAERLRAGWWAWAERHAACAAIPRRATRSRA